MKINKEKLKDVNGGGVYTESVTAEKGVFCESAKIINRACGVTINNLDVDTPTVPPHATYPRAVPKVAGVDIPISQEAIQSNTAIRTVSELKDTVSKDFIK